MPEHIDLTPPLSAAKLTPILHFTLFWFYFITLIGIIIDLNIVDGKVLV